ncbi:hypothetical protein ACWGJ2_33525 [Streptomyces sp. NPDC054796]
MFDQELQEVTRTETPVMLVPDLVEEMVAERQNFQLVKFRTTCTDCVPNL